MATHQATQDYVTARHAADLCRVSERTVRRHIASGKLPAERLADGDYAIPVSALATLRRVAKERAHRRGDLPAEVASLRAEVEALRSRLDALETRPAYRASEIRASIAGLSRQDGTQTGASDGDASSISPTRARPPERHYNATFSPHGRSMRQEDGVWTHAEAARWLVRHGIASETTPKSWPGWRETPPTPADVLALALSFADAGNWRKSWRLHPCDDPACVCHALLGGNGGNGGNETRRIEQTTQEP